ncbi:putative transposase like protein [Trichonephila clavipes]|nr:putative transposase like protein [Trichonephila clavipes]
MQDGVPCHTARSIKAFLAEQNIPLLDWPGNSPDMNPIENVWELMKRELAKDVITNKTQAALRKNNSRVKSSSSNSGDSTVLY